jgi:citrate lyase beta subunit
MPRLPDSLRALHDTIEAGRATLCEAASEARARLPLRFWRQQAHFTTPASNLDMARKAVEAGMSAAPRLLQRFEIEPVDLAETLGIGADWVAEVLAADPRAPLVMLDGEDAQALSDDVVERGRDNAVRLLRDAEWGSSLRFYRPSGLALSYASGDLAVVLTEIARDREPRDYPLDGIVWPKVEHPAEMRWLCDTLGQIEHHLGLPERRIRVSFLVESGWALAELPAIARASAGRLASIIFGIADYAADIGLVAIENDHPACDAARIQIGSLAGALGVPAIDNMTVKYPVAEKALSPADNRAHVLSRMKLCFDDALHGRALGMDGKWVGHPLQLLACRLAFGLGLAEQAEAEAAKIEAYRAVAGEGIGATMIEGVMSDRATDRHARILVRRAVAQGAFDPARAVALGVLSPSELGERGG